VLSYELIASAARVVEEAPVRFSVENGSSLPWTYRLMEYGYEEDIDFRGFSGIV